MAKRVIEELIDDLDGSEADETVTFALDGVSYTIDLSEVNAAALREAIDPYRQRAERLGRAPSPNGHVRSARPGPAGGKDFNAKVREWAASKGVEVADRGRIRQEIIDQYNAELAAQAKRAATSVFIKESAAKVNGVQPPAAAPTPPPAPPVVEEPAPAAHIAPKKTTRATKAAPAKAAPRKAASRARG